MTIIPDISKGQGKMLHVWLQFTGTLHMAPLIFLCYPFGLTIVFQIQCTELLFVGMLSTYKLFTLAWNGRLPWLTLEWQVLQIRSFPSNDNSILKMSWEG